MRLAVLVVSDTCVREHALDSSGPAVISMLPFFKDTAVQYVADTVEDIKDAVTRLAASHDMLVTTGGTGFSPNDVTPEAVKQVFDREAPGLVAAMLFAGLKITPAAALARPVAGVAGRCLIISVPGSPKAVKETLGSIKDIIPHALRLLDGESSRKIHNDSAEMESISSVDVVEDIPAVDTSDRGSEKPQSLLDANPAYHLHECSGHSRSHSAPRFYATAGRPRTSPYPMISYKEALSIVLENTPKPHGCMVPLQDSLGYITSEDIFAPLNVPPFRASIVDGYAVTHSDCPGTLPVSKVLTASSDLAIFKRSTCVRITTGAPVPHGATAVVPVENTTVAEAENGEEIKITINAADVRSGDNVRKIGSDLALGGLVLPKGTRISALGGEVGTLASTGMFCVPVFARPTVGVLSTGNELVNVDGTCYGSQIWDSNRPMLITALRARHIPVVDLGIVRDDREELYKKLRDALDRVDILVSTGGVSMGELDLLKPTIEDMGGNIHFGRVAIKPGKPVTFATKGSKCIFALPGNPASAAVCLQLFVIPCFEKWSGGNPHASRIKVRIEEPIKLDPRPEFHRVHVDVSGDGWVAKSTGFQRSSRVKSLVSANAVLCLPESTPERQVLPAHSHVDAILLCPP